MNNVINAKYKVHSKKVKKNGIAKKIKIISIILIIINLCMVFFGTVFYCIGWYSNFATITDESGTYKKSFSWFDGSLSDKISNLCNGWYTSHGFTFHLHVNPAAKPLIIIGVVILAIWGLFSLILFIYFLVIGIIFIVKKINKKYIRKV